MPLDNQAPAIGDIIADSGETEFNLAFVLDSGGCTPAWDGSAGQPVSSDTAVLADVNAIRAVEPWAPGTCSNISQSPYDFTKTIVKYTG